MNGTFHARENLTRTPFVNDRPRLPSPSKTVKAVLSPVQESEDGSKTGSPGSKGSPATVANSTLKADTELRCVPPSEELLEKVVAKKGEEATLDEFKQAFQSRPKMPRTPS